MAIQQKATLKTVEGKEAKHAKLTGPKAADLPEIDDYERPELEKYDKPEFEKYDKPEKPKKVTLNSLLRLIGRWGHRETC